MHPSSEHGGCCEASAQPDVEAGPEGSPLNLPCDATLACTAHSRAMVRSLPCVAADKSQAKPPGVHISPGESAAHVFSPPTPSSERVSCCPAEPCVLFHLVDVCDSVRTVIVLDAAEHLWARAAAAVGLTLGAATALG
jgi:hypothetical protein